MIGAVLFAVVYFLCCEGGVVIRSDVEHPAVNNRPIIGILSQELSDEFKTIQLKENYTSYIAASYVKDVEKSGALVVPIMIGKNRSYYKELMGKLNGVLLPGGDAPFDKSGGYADAGQYILDIAQELNDAGDYFPVYGTCLGFELLIVLASGRETNNFVVCKSIGYANIKFTDDFRNSKMFKQASGNIVHLLNNMELTYNYHQYCILDQNLKSHNLTKDWRPTSHSNDENGVEFIATIENNRYPFFGSQFHPEKSPYEWISSNFVKHSANAVEVNRYFMDFFVRECRKSTHTFASRIEENKYVIYNFAPHFTAPLKDAYYYQCYFF